MAYTPKLNHIAGACALLFCINAQTFAQSETQLSPVVVTEKNQDDLNSKFIQWGFGAGDWKDKTQSISTITREQIDAQISQRSSDVVTNDSSVGRNYTPIGYYESFSIRGFALDSATAYKINGMSMASEANIPLENKERVEIIKGISALEAGILSPGGLINYVTKRANQDVNSVSMGLGEKGSFSQAVDHGRKQTIDNPIGYRINIAHEDYKPYVKAAKGYRNFASLALDMSPSATSKWEADIDFQKRSQFSVPGYQLLGANGIPPIDPHKHLTAEQTWQSPVETEQINFGTKFTQGLDNGWKATGGYQISRIKTDDNLAFPWSNPESGNYFDAANQKYPVNSNKFNRDGRFIIYDFRSLNETRQNQELKFELAGKAMTNKVTHELTFGTSVQYRKVSQPNWINNCAQSLDYCGNTVANPGGGITPGSIYGTSTVYDRSSSPPIDFYQYSNQQRSFYFQDNISSKDYLGNSKLHIGGRIVDISEKWMNGYAGKTGNSEDTKFLPSLGVSYQGIKGSTQYFSYSKGLELGGQAPIIATNYADPMKLKETHQYEIGNKTLLLNSMQLGVSAFRIDKPYEYTTIGGGFYQSYVQAGKQTHTGLEANVSGSITQRTSINASASLIDTNIEGSGGPHDGKKAVNVPTFSSNVFALYRVPGQERLSLNATWRYVGSKYVTRENDAKVPAYHRFDLGAAKSYKNSHGLVTVRVGVENIFDKRYWSDAPEFMGDSYLIPGAPRVARATATFDF
jgi:iron complex outermembrane receptor protein